MWGRGCKGGGEEEGGGGGVKEGVKQVFHFLLLFPPSVQDFFWRNWAKKVKDSRRGGEGVI